MDLVRNIFIRPNVAVKLRGHFINKTFHLSWPSQLEPVDILQADIQKLDQSTFNLP
jgi:hypothetical protein